MRIDGTDAIKRAQDSQTLIRDSQLDIVVSSAVENKLVTQATEAEREDYTISDKAVMDAVDRVNKAITGSNRQFEFSVHEKTNRIMVKVIDTSTKEIIREIPPEKILDMVAQMWEMAGILVDERR